MRRTTHGAYALAAWLLVASVAYQTFLAGVAVFGGPQHWARHTGFVHVFEFIPLLMIVLALVARVPRQQGLYLYPFALWLMIGAQYGLAAAGPAMIAALHPVNALAIFWISVLLARRATETFKDERRGG